MERALTSLHISAGVGKCRRSLRPSPGTWNILEGNGPFLMRIRATPAVSATTIRPCRLPRESHCPNVNFRQLIAAFSSHHFARMSHSFELHRDRMKTRLTPDQPLLRSDRRCLGSGDCSFRGIRGSRPLSTVSRNHGIFRSTMRFYANLRLT